MALESLIIKIEMEKLRVEVRMWFVTGSAVIPTWGRAGKVITRRWFKREAQQKRRAFEMALSYKLGLSFCLSTKAVQLCVPKSRQQWGYPGFHWKRVNFLPSSW